jgi:hypothetical protein
MMLWCYLANVVEKIAKENTLTFSQTKQTVFHSHIKQLAGSCCAHAQPQRFGKQMGR